MSPLDLIRSRDGSMSLTKLAASSFHLLLFVTVGWITYLKREFLTDMWVFYGVAAVGHAFSDKTLAAVAAFKNKKLDVESDMPPTVTTVTTTQGPAQ